MLRTSRRRRRRTRFVLLLIIAVSIGSIIDFAYHAYQKTNLFTSSSSYTHPLTGEIGWDSSRHPEEDRVTGAREIELDRHMALDAAVVLLGLAAVLGISVKLSKTSRQKKWLVLGVEAGVVTSMVVTALLWTLTLWERPAELTKLGTSRDDGGALYESTPHPDLPSEMTIAGGKVSSHK